MPARAAMRYGAGLQVALPSSDHQPGRAQQRIAQTTPTPVSSVNGVSQSHQPPA